MTRDVCRCPEHPMNQTNDVSGRSYRFSQGLLGAVPDAVLFIKTLVAEDVSHAVCYLGEAGLLAKARHGANGWWLAAQ